MTATSADVDLLRAPLSVVRALDFRDPSRDLQADEATIWARLRATWAGLDDAAWPVPGPAPSDAGGPAWSFLEHVAHVEDWQGIAIAYVGRALETGEWPTDADFDGGDFDRFNDGRRPRYATIMPVELRARLADSRATLLDLVRRLPDDVVRSDAAWGWLFLTLHGHYLDHLAAIEPWADRLRARQDQGDPFVADPRPLSFEAYRDAGRVFEAQLEELLGDLPAGAWTSGEVTPGWTLRDHVGHLADWAEEGVRAVEVFRRDGRWPADPPEGIDAWNAKMVARSRGEAADAARERYERGFVEMREAAEGLSLAELRDAEGWSWVHDCLYGHLRKHLALIGPYVALLDRAAFDRQAGAGLG